MRISVLARCVQDQQRTLEFYRDGLPFIRFNVDDVSGEHERLAAQGVKFTMPPTPMGEVKAAVFDDQNGHYIQLIEGA